ncbi:LAMI_0H05644g1_1 [Lachancea mirantina]|uniref:LAMI_0H05644g1_1 n=1 Tax=Lachancea mirantina TaxID=1230905 RepID=A0A1G4KFB7_9SACH|nr:LAMI_0H05644g1_1 [Lachancea mirantina]
MDTLVTFIMGLPCPVGVLTPVSTFLSSKKIITSPNLLMQMHSIVYVAIAYHIVFLVSQWILFPPLVRLRFACEKPENDKKPETKVDDEIKQADLVNQSAVHFVSLVQSLVILYLSLSYLSGHGRSTHPTPESRVFSQSPKTDVVCVFAVGYFVWDALISVMYSSFPFVLHGVVSMVMFSIGLQPYIQYYAPAFLLFELSNPFLNFRWFGIKYLPQVSDRNHSFVARVCNALQLANNVILMLVFLLARIVWGWLKIGELCYDFFQVRNDPRFRPLETAVIVAGNLTLDVLNVVWFSTMLGVAKRIVSKRGRVQDKPVTEAH